MQEEHHRWRATWIGSDALLARRVARPVARFLQIEAASGFVLVGAAVAALVLANSPWQDGYHQLWATQLTVDIGSWSTELSLLEVVNDGLMTLFFFVVGLEIKREIVSGPLRDPRVAALPVAGAIGGMVVPALVYVGLNAGGAGASGWAIPVATDIAFAVGVVALLGNRVPVALKLFLLTLAVVDDIGGIVIIAVVFSHGMQWTWLAAAVAGLLAIAALRRARVWHLGVYVALGAAVWYCTWRSGVHATIAGVVLGFLCPTVPLRDEPATQEIADRLENQPELSAADVRNAAFHIRESVPVDRRLTERLHPWTAFAVVPVFAFANAGVTLSDASVEGFPSRVTLGVVLGLVVGKALGVFGASAIAVKARVARVPAGVTWVEMFGIACAAGMGFTVSLFLTALAFGDDAALGDQAKLGVLVASAAAALAAAGVFAIAARRLPAEVLARQRDEEAAFFASDGGDPDD